MQQHRPTPADEPARTTSEPLFEVNDVVRLKRGRPDDFRRVAMVLPKHADDAFPVPFQLYIIERPGIFGSFEQCVGEIDLELVEKGPHRLVPLDEPC